MSTAGQIRQAQEEAKHQGLNVAGAIGQGVGTLITTGNPMLALAAGGKQLLSGQKESGNVAQDFGIGVAGPVINKQITDFTQSEDIKQQAAKQAQLDAIEQKRLADGAMNYNNTTGKIYNTKAVPVNGKLVVDFDRTSEGYLKAVAKLNNEAAARNAKELANKSPRTWKSIITISEQNLPLMYLEPSQPANTTILNMDKSRTVESSTGTTVYDESGNATFTPKEKSEEKFTTIVNTAKAMAKDQMRRVDLTNMSDEDIKVSEDAFTNFFVDQQKGVAVSEPVKGRTGVSIPLLPANYRYSYKPVDLATLTGKATEQVKDLGPAPKGMVEGAIYTKGDVRVKVIDGRLIRQ